MDDVFNILFVILFIVLPLLDKFREKKKDVPQAHQKTKAEDAVGRILRNALERSQEQHAEHAAGNSARVPSFDDVREAEALLRHRGELLPNETMWQPETLQEAVVQQGALQASMHPMDDMQRDEAAAALRGAAHTAAYTKKRKREEAAMRAAEQAAYEKAAKLPGVQSASFLPRVEMTAEKAREAIVLATILGAPKAKTNGCYRRHKNNP